jgi:hypothetical protein
MDIEAFYDADARRRPSAELELGTEWHDGHDVRYELNYVEDTGELYVMQEPPPHEWADPFGGVYVWATSNTDEKKMIVRVVATMETVGQLHQVLEGWQDKMNEPNSVAWLADRLRTHGVATPQD